MRLLKGRSWVLALATLFALCLTISAAMGFAPGRAMGQNFLSFLVQMLKVLPCVFVLIGVFEVWVKTETVEKHLGAGAGPMSYLWAVLLAGTTVGGLHLALPVAHALHLKRAKLGAVLAFLSSSAVCRVPMTMFEASFLGWRFTCVRFAISLPLIIITSAALGAWCERKRYRLPDPDTFARR